MSSLDSDKVRSQELLFHTGFYTMYKTSPHTHLPAMKLSGPSCASFKTVSGTLGFPGPRAQHCISEKLIGQTMGGAIMKTTL